MTSDHQAEQRQGSPDNHPPRKNIAERRLGFIVGVACTLLASLANDLTTGGTRKVETTETVTPRYRVMRDEDTAAIRRINSQAALFAEHYSQCAAGATPAERYIKTHKLISSFVDSALLENVDPAEFANNLEYAMIQNMRIVPAELPQGILAVFHDNADQGRDVMLVQKDTLSVYGAIPRFFNHLAAQNYNTDGKTVLLTTKQPGKFEHVTITDPHNITVNGEQIAERLKPQLRFSQPCGA